MYDVTLNFKDNQTPTLLGIVNGKKYKADMSVRSVLLLRALVSGSYSTRVLPSEESGFQQSGADAVVDAPLILPGAFLVLEQCSSEST